MRNSYLSLIVLLMMSIFTPMQAQTYDKFWKDVQQLEKKDLPKSVVSEAMKIYAKAKAEQNAPQMMKAYLKAMQYRASITPDSLNVDMEGLEKWAQETKSIEDKSVLYSILGELVMSKDMKKAFGYLNLSLKEKGQLVALSVDKLKPIAEVGEASKRYFHDNLYNMMARRAISLMQQNKWKVAAIANQTDNLPSGIENLESFVSSKIVPVSDCDFSATILQIYQSLLNLYNTPNDRSAWLLTGIDALDYLQMNFSKGFSKKYCCEELRSWTTRYADAEVGAEVYVALAGYLQWQNNQVERLKVVREGVARYANNERVNQLKNIEKEILNPSLSLTVPASYPGQMQTINVNYKNLNGVTLRLYKVNLPVSSVFLQGWANSFLSKYGKLQHTEHFALKETPDYLQVDTTLKIQTPSPGVYYLQAIPDAKNGKAEGTLMYVTSLQVIHRSMPNGKLEMVVVDGATGQPVPDAEVVTYVGKHGNLMPSQTYPVNKEGTALLGLLSSDRNLYYNVQTANDHSMPISNLWRSVYYMPETSHVKDVLQLYTDRSIYRPGQTVYVSGIAYQQHQDSTQVLVDKNYTISLYDVNRNKLGDVTVQTNKFGSFSGQFTLPSPCLSGAFRIAAGSASVEFRVEEYKRPTFDVTFEPVKVEYQAGDSIQLTGLAQTFAGAPVQNAKVSYRIVRSYSWYWRFPGSRTASWEGETVTNAEGKFTVPVRFEVGAEKNGTLDGYYSFRVEADVTDGAGEMQQGNLSLPLGATSVVLGIVDMRDLMVKEKAVGITFSAANLFGEPVNTDIVYQVFELNKQQGDTDKEGKCVFEATVKSNQKFVPESLYALPSGSYRLKISAKDAQGRECKASQDFILFSLNDKRPPITTSDWFYQDGVEFDAKSPAAIYIGSSDKDVYLLYDVFAGDKRIESKRITFSDSIVSFPFTYKEEYGNGILINLAFVKNGRVYTHTAEVLKPVPDKKLQLKWTVFRDKFRPGQQEEWKLSVLYPDGRPADAELLAMMYDASLDKFYKHNLSFGLNFDRAVPRTNWNAWNAPSYYIYVDFPWNRLKYRSLQYSRLLVPIMEARKELMIRGMASNYSMAAKSRGGVLVPEADDDVVVEEQIVQVLPSRSAGILEDTKDVQVRENFAETAFFYPQLHTDAQGEVSISFVLPESLTQWKFMGLAHTKNVDYGQLEATATTSKEFMLQPNMPRFVRVGDKVNIAASLINMSDKAVKGMVRMELFNPETDKVFYSQKQKFGVEARETGNVNFTFDVSDKYDVIACRMIADGDTFSDGEQRYIPVLTDKQWITETVPLNVNGKGTYTFSLENLFNHHSATASQSKLTVEFTSNPAWYAVQALPVVANPSSEDALSWASAYYANALAESIATSHPRIKQVFDSWKAQGGTKETFMSQLQKNEDLKNILLAETPWLAEATNEMEQRQRIATLFDLNTMNGKQALAVERLRELQTKEGAWSWYKGMQGSRYITTQITEMLARLQTMAGGKLNVDVSAMYQKALNYLADAAMEEYKSMKEAEKKGATALTPSEQVLQYLYICALDGKPVANPNVNRYFIEKLTKMTTDLTIYGKALSAIVLQQAGETAKAEVFMQSLMEYSVSTEEMGRYFDTPKAQYSWFSYRIPTEVAAMEAVQYITKNEQVIDQMKRWLLKQKQTQTWDTPIATVNAIYALLTTGSSDLLADTGVVKITLGKEMIQTSPTDALGYIKKTLTNDVMSIRKVTVNKESEGMGWGAVYAQYLEKMDKITMQGNGLSISRQLYKGENLLDETSPLKVGDKISVRLIVKADRDMDFVQIKDERSACMEPVETLSGYRWGNSLGYYQVTKDASTQFFVDQMRKGTYVIEYQVYVNRTGKYQAGIATIQSAYAPEFGGHTSGYQMIVK